MEKSNQASFGEMLKVYRKQQGLTQQQLAKKLAVHHNTVGAWERGDYLPATRGMILELARCLRLNEGETHHLLDAGLITVASRWNVPYQRNPFFTGRQKILQRIHAILTQEQNFTSTRSCALSGLAGIGKTQTVIEYAYQYALNYSAIFWIRAETEESIISSFVAMATTLKLPVHHLQAQEHVIAIIHGWLTSHHNWLLIFDNIEHIELAWRFLPRAREGSLLFTTRRPTLGSLAPCLELSSLSLQESVQMLLRRAGSQLLHGPAMAIHAEEEQSVRDLAVALGGLPLALEQAAACIEELHCSFSRFLHLFQLDAMQMLQEHPSSVLYPHSVTKTFTLAFERLQQDNPVGADLLMLCCFLAPNEIPEALLIQGKSYLEPELQAVLSNPIRLSATVKDILAYALLRRDTRTETLSVHPLVQIVLKGKLSEMAQRAWVERLIRMLNRLFLLEQDQVDMEYWSWYEQVLPHAQVVLQLAEHWQLFSPELGSLLNRVAIYLFHRAHYKQAEVFYLRAISIQEQVGPDQDDLALALTGLASIHYRQGRDEEGEVFYPRATSLVEGRLGPEQIQYLAWLAYKQERYADAETFISCVFALREQNSLPDQFDLASILHLKANIHRIQGRYEDARLLYQYALSIYQRVLEPEHINIALLTSDFAKLYLCQAQWEKAGQLYQEALHLWERFQDLDHPDYADCLESYAELLRQQQEGRDADLYIRCAREIRARHLVTPLAPLQKVHLSVDSEDAIESLRLARLEEEDLFETFLQQCCVLSAQSACWAAELWHAYQKWVLIQEKALPLSRQAFSLRLKTKGCSQARTNAHRFWCGIELKGGKKSDEYQSLADVGSRTS